ncbi:uncharacterized protein SAPINGB_P006091 [Magnusiomyces paraingens]|uniref:FAD dependent oxidoreductase domain-containing protein n=1 Tax=Magnusiomyces paraingens TaxID=2606893 RepID=A0A5E8C8D0_9ASCO|nr:uncharacterized protein SAPINGB_P006091 [Saprochaete ingens]VVT58208.1 unnamed protein product [Saprochaete ingens]
MSSSTTLPPPPIKSPHFSLWASPLSPLANFQSSSSLPSSADVVIIGSGFSGASVAYHLLVDPSSSTSSSYYHQNPSLTSSPNKKPRVVMLEARQTCSGASGRNGGHLHPSFTYGAATWATDDDATRNQHLAKIAFDAKNYSTLAALIAQNNIASAQSIFTDGPNNSPSSSLAAGWAVYDTPQEFAQACAVVSAYIQASPEPDHPPIRIYSRDEARKRTGLTNIAGALHCPATPLCGYSLVSWLLMECITKGNLQLHSNTPVRAVTRETPEAVGRDKPLEYVIKTSRGPIKTPVIIFATNAYTGNLVSKSTVSPKAYLDSIKQSVSPEVFARGSSAIVIPPSSQVTVKDYFSSARNVLSSTSSSMQGPAASLNNNPMHIDVEIETRLRTEIYPVRGQVAHYQAPHILTSQHLTAVRPTGVPKLSLVWNDEYLAVVPQRSGDAQGQVDIVFGGCRRFGASKQVGLTDDNSLSNVVSWTLDDYFATRIGVPLQSSEDPVEAMAGSFTRTLVLDDSKEANGSVATTTAVKVQEWTGIMGFTRDERPCVGSLIEDEEEAQAGPRVLVIGGFGGHGMPRIFLSAKALVHRYLRKVDDTEEANSWPLWFPSEYIN